jgi:hypothetical protein
MGIDEIPERQKRFLSRYIDTVGKLEILLLLFETKPKDWTPLAVSEKLHCGLQSAKTQLKALAQSQLLTFSENNEPQYHFQTFSPDLHSDVQAIAKLYHERRTSVIEFIYASPVEKIKTFANAFKIRKDD